MERIFSRYTWAIYAERMLSLTNIYRCVNHPCRKPPAFLYFLVCLLGLCLLYRSSSGYLENMGVGTFSPLAGAMF